MNILIYLFEFIYYLSINQGCQSNRAIFGQSTIQISSFDYSDGNPIEIDNPKFHRLFSIVFRLFLRLFFDGFFDCISFVSSIVSSIFDKNRSNTLDLNRSNPIDNPIDEKCSNRQSRIFSIGLDGFGNPAINHYLANTAILDFLLAGYSFYRQTF